MDAETELVDPPTPSPFTAGTTSSIGNDRESEGYFALRGVRLPPTEAIETQDLQGQSPVAVSLAALQYLPVPILVLSSDKSILLANAAMGRLLQIDMESLQRPRSDIITVTDVLRGQGMAQLQIDILQRGSPIKVSWEVRNSSIPRSHLHKTEFKCA